MLEQVILVDEHDNALGLMEKMEAHRKAKLHRAFSVFAMNDQNEILLNLNVNICSNFLDQDIPEFANEIEIKFIDNKDSFTESEWNSLYKLAEDTFVEESDSLKEGAAGAGLTDND